MEEKKKEALQIGFGVLVLLVVLTVGEYWVGSVAATWWAPLIGIGLIKAYFVVRDYMHIGRVFAGDEEVH
jgi:hypothetical protein